MFENRSSPDWSSDGTDNDDPWPRITAAIAAGDLTVRMRKTDSPVAETVADMTVYEFSIGFDAATAIDVLMQGESLTQTSEEET